MCSVVVLIHLVSFNRNLNNFALCSETEKGLYQIMATSD